MVVARRRGKFEWLLGCVRRYWIFSCIKDYGVLWSDQRIDLDIIWLELKVDIQGYLYKRRKLTVV
jgi:hypothetical protein